MIGLVSCCGPKLAHAAPARDLYRSPLFRLSKAWAERHCDRWFVLSALHGLVEPDRVIEPYNQVLAVKAWKWGARVVEQLCDARVAHARFAILAGERYVRPFRGTLEIEEPLAGKQIGQRLSWLKQHTLEVHP